MIEIISIAVFAYIVGNLPIGWLMSIILNGKYQNVTYNDITHPTPMLLWRTKQRTASVLTILTLTVLIMSCYQISLAVSHNSNIAALGAGFTCLGMLFPVTNKLKPVNFITPVIAFTVSIAPIVGLVIYSLWWIGFATARKPQTVSLISVLLIPLLSVFLTDIINAIFLTVISAIYLFINKDLLLNLHNNNEVKLDNIF